MPVKLKDFTLKFKGIFGDKRKTVVLVIVGIVGIILIGLSDMDFSSKNEVRDDKNEQQSVESYIISLEKKTEKMVSQISGAGKSKIMITADVSREYDYATNQSKSEEVSNDNKTSIDFRSEVILYDDGDGDNALVKKAIEPKIRGVLVLCEGAGNPSINEEITSAVKTVLGVSSNKICVLKLK